MMSQSGQVRICIVPRVHGVGGMVSFLHKLSQALPARGIQVCYDLSDLPYQAVLVIGGARQLPALWAARRRGVRIVQRLDGMNWLHRVRPSANQPRPGVRHFLRAEYGNLLLNLIRTRLAQRVVYQSRFAQAWWERAHGPSPAQASVVYNGVDLDEYTPTGPGERSSDHYRLLLVEGSLMGGYELGLQAAVGLAQGLEERLRAAPQLARPNGVELAIAGRVAGSVRQAWAQASTARLTWLGLLPRQRIPEVARSSHLLYSADIHPACPNAVIEAMACGLPVTAFDTGALPELVCGDAGRLAPYGSDPWRLEAPHLPGLVEAAMEILAEPERFRVGARQRAEQAFGLEMMVAGYLEALLG